MQYLLYVIRRKEKREVIRQLYSFTFSHENVVKNLYKSLRNLIRGKTCSTTFTQTAQNDIYLR